MESKLAVEKPTGEAQDLIIGFDMERTTEIDSGMAHTTEIDLEMAYATEIDLDVANIDDIDLCTVPHRKFSRASVSTINTFNYAELDTLFEDVCVLKRNATDSIRQAKEIESLRGQLCDLKNQVDRLAKRSGACAQEMNNTLHTSISSFPTGTARDSSRHPTLSKSPSTWKFHDSVATWHRANDRIVEESELKKTVWDALILIRLSILPLSDEILTVTVTILASLMQLVFILLVARTEGDFNTRDIVMNLTDWRVNYAHDPKYADHFNVPLAAGVCQRNPFIMEGAYQAQFFKQIDDYLNDFHGLRAGDVLCMLACTLWISTCIVELHYCRQFLLGIWISTYDGGDPQLTGMKRLWSSPSSVNIVIPDVVLNDVELPLKSIRLTASLSRSVALTCFVFLPRVAVLLSLGYVGVLFLIATIELQELILNAVALEVVLHVDEMFFHIFLPSFAKRLLTVAIPFRLPSGSHLSNTLWPYLRLIAVGLILAIIRVFLLEPVMSNVVEAHKAMCSGYTDFLAVELASGPMLAGRPAVGRFINRSSYSYKAILQRTGLQTLGTAKHYLDADLPGDLTPYKFSEAMHAQRFAELTIAELADHPFDMSLNRKVGCQQDLPWVKFYPDTENALWLSIQQQTKDPHIKSCLQLKTKGFCVDTGSGGKAARMFCPVTCGVGNITSGLSYMSAHDGVATADCELSLGSALEEAPCEDLPDSHPAFGIYGESIWQMLYPAFAQLSARSTPGHMMALKSNVTGMISAGCQSIKNGMQIPHVRLGTFHLLQLCSPEHLAIYGVSKFRSARYLCPVTCGCLQEAVADAQDGKNWTKAIGVGSQCPKACFRH